MFMVARCLVAVGESAKRRKAAVTALAPRWLWDNLWKRLLMEGLMWALRRALEDGGYICSVLKTGLVWRVCLGF